MQSNSGLVHQHIQFPSQPQQLQVQLASGQVPAQFLAQRLTRPSRPLAHHSRTSRHGPRIPEAPQASAAGPSALQARRHHLSRPASQCPRVLSSAARTAVVLVSPVHLALMLITRLPPRQAQSQALWLGARRLGKTLCS